METIVTIRQTCKEDLQDLLHLYAHLHSDDDALPPQSDLARIWGALCDNPAIRCIAADLEGQIISSCILLIIPNLTRGARPYGIIENVITHPGFRREGHAKAVLQYALELAQSAGCYKVMLLSNRKNEEAHRLYEALGFDRHTKYGYVMYWHGK
jgi:GNAT superfamily N-acetyltransferase